MSQSICSRCLSRSFQSFDASITSSSSHPANLIQRAAFSTTPSVSAAVAKKKVVTKPSTRQGKTLRLSKNKRESSGRPPAPGERKALRKKIVLSNNNALEVRGLQSLTRDNATSERLAEVEGRVLALADNSVEALKSLEAFKHTQGWHYFRKPATLVRKETVKLAQAMESGEVKRCFLFGEQGSGKSVLQLQAMAMALQKDWVVVHLPNAQDIAIGHTAYEPSPDGGKTYIQPEYTASLLANIAKGNQRVLSKLQLSQNHDLPIPVQSNISLDRFAELGARDPDVAWPIYVALMNELSLPSSSEVQRPPLLLSMDVADHVMANSGYLDTNIKPIHAHDLALVSHYFSYLNGKTKLPNGGLVIAALSESNAVRSPTLSHVIATKYGMQTSWSDPTWSPHAGWEAPRQPVWDPYAPFDQRVAHSLEGVEMWKLQGLSKEEAKGVMEYYALSGMLRREVTDKLVSEKWTLSGGGVIGELERGSVRARI